MTLGRVLLGMALAAAFIPSGAAAAQPGTPGDPIVVASKPFGESFLLAELFAQQLEAAGLVVVRRPGLGATEILHGALRRDAIDVYPEYTGTGLIAILRDTLPPDVLRDPRAVFVHVARTAQARHGTRWLAPLGFENSYAIAVSDSLAAAHDLRTLSDLARIAPSLSAGFTSDFIGRPDALPALADRYGMRFREVRALGQALKFQAIAADAVQVIDGYATDGLFARYALTVLTDDRRAFPPYEAAALTSPRLARDAPAAIAALSALSARLDAATMRAFNARLEVGGEPVGPLARALRDTLGLTGGEARSEADDRGTTRASSWLAFLVDQRRELLRHTVRHVQLVLGALLAALVLAVPLGLGVARRTGVVESLLTPLAVVQTIPSIALLAFLVPVLGIGVRPALLALWLYALYPIARATADGIRAADPDADLAAHALGMTPRQRLLQVRLPLAAGTIVGGIRTSAAITVGAATLAAFIGAGGLGEPIVRGLALADPRLLLAGAVPAALLALLIDSLLRLAERRLTPAHLRFTGDAR